MAGKGHGFISFTLDLNKLGHHDWLLLGEASSKIAHMIGVPIQPTVAAELQTMAIVKGARATTAIEGNTLSEDEVRKIVDRELRLPTSKAYLQREIENVVGACNDVLLRMASQVWAGVSEQWLMEQNARILAGLPLREEVVPGAWRDHKVGVGTYLAPPPEDVPRLMKGFAAWLPAMVSGDTPPQLRRPMALLRAVVAHLYIAWIHPFGDGNGRTARLLELGLLLEAGVPSVSAHVLSNHYNETRSAYYRELDEASATGNPYKFITYSLQGLVDGLRSQIRVIQQQQEQVIWTNFVYETLDPKTEAEKRRSRLALALAGRSKGVRRSELTAISPRVAGDYAGKTVKTLTRDLNVLRDKKLLIFRAGRWHANVDVIRAFKPFSAAADDWS